MTNVVWESCPAIAIDPDTGNSSVPTDTVPLMVPLPCSPAMSFRPKAAATSTLGTGLGVVAATLGDALGGACGVAGAPHAAATITAVASAAILCSEPRIGSLHS